jgi:acetyl/propionyl-CoA carboxylase alpha subunit
MNYQYQVNDEMISIRVEKAGAGYAVTIGEQEFTVSATRWRDGELSFTLDGARHRAWVAADGPRRWVALDGQTVMLTVPDTTKRARRGKGTASHDTLEAQMPGVVRRVLVSAGERVERGQALVVLEAMKMEIKVAAPHAGLIVRLAVREGETIQRGQLLVELQEQV